MRRPAQKAVESAERRERRLLLRITKNHEEVMKAGILVHARAMRTPKGDHPTGRERLTDGELPVVTSARCFISSSPFAGKMRRAADGDCGSTAGTNGNYRWLAASNTLTDWGGGWLDRAIGEVRSQVMPDL
jgi:hypothetical protein